MIECIRIPASQSWKVAVIGCGAAGLGALRHLSSRLDVFEPVAFEQTSNIGGTWNYTDNVGSDEHGLPIHSSMYKSLRTNLPKEVMAFPDFPFDEKSPSYLPHTDVLDYLEKYAIHFNLLRFVKFYHVVQKVRPLPAAEDRRNYVRWELTSMNLKTDQVTVVHFDAVIVCNGHFSKPLIPDTLNVSSFNGPVLHSHDYRSPVIFQHKSVVVVGAGPSGIDISVELSRFTKKIYLCRNTNRFSGAILPNTIVVKSGVRSIVPDGVVLESGEFIAADAIILCTGYRYSFPFLSADCQLSVTADNRIASLYKSLFHILFPTMSFIGIPKLIIPFPLFDRQAQFIVAQLCGKVVLPEVPEMEDEVRRDYDKYLATGKSARHFHDLGPLQWAYLKSLEAEVGMIPLAPVVRKLADECKLQRSIDVVSYKNIDYRIVDKNSFTELSSERQQSD